MPVVRVYFWVTDGWLFGTLVARGREAGRGGGSEREEIGGDERRRVLRWDIGEWFHACIPRTPWATKERCARDPSGIIEYHLPLCSFLSLFFSARRWVQTRIGYPPVYACVVTNARARSMWTGWRWRRRYGDKRAHTFVLVMRYTYGSRAIMLSAHRHRTPGTLCDPRIRIPSACIMLLLRFSWKASSKSCERDSEVRRHECAVTHRRSMNRMYATLVA